MSLGKIWRGAPPSVVAHCSLPPPSQDAKDEVSSANFQLEKTNMSVFRLQDLLEESAAKVKTLEAELAASAANGAAAAAGGAAAAAAAQAVVSPVLAR